MAVAMSSTFLQTNVVRGKFKIGRSEDFQLLTMQTGRNIGTAMDYTLFT